ncbi:hypothetical protein PLESTB_001973800 [Pleodorina starrii]|uniref:Uncharacterized protein n=1 Tax=Pleodorina starrii TaxID=330485 RepID=A0A9W6C3K3_9CHLO|nr:hypothetical protein PLESTB_001973800 [Pleodorina starrii]
MVLFESAVEGVHSKDHAVTALVYDDALTGLPVHHHAGRNSSRVTSDLRSPQLESQRPVQERGDKLMVSGSDEQVRAQLARMGVTPQQIEEAMAGATVEQLGEQTFSFTLEFDPRLWARLTAKIALGSGYAAASEWFTDTEVARSLQKICHGRVAEYPPMASADLQQ